MTHQDQQTIAQWVCPQFYFPGDEFIGRHPNVLPDLTVHGKSWVEEGHDVFQLRFFDVKEGKLSGTAVACLFRIEFRRELATRLITDFQLDAVWTSETDVLRQIQNDMLLLKLSR